MTRSILAGAMVLAVLGGCSIIPPGRPVARSAAAPSGADLIGTTLRVDAGSGRVSTMRFEADGAVEAEFGQQKARGSWVVADGKLCFSWGNTSRECWPYSAPFQRGQTVTLTSDRGNVVRVTRL